MTFNASAVTVVNAPVGKVWDAITVPAQVKKYFFGTDLVTDWKVGSQVLFRGDWKGKPYEDKGTVLEFDPKKHLSFDYFSPLGGKEDKHENYQVITYDLNDTDGGTEVRITQTNAPTAEAAGQSSSNWKSVLEGLKKMVEDQAGSKV
jgi:uncharacterized protein YndB with AHSA1/START domain